MRLAFMQGITSAATVKERDVSRAERLKGTLFALAVLVITATLFGWLFNRERVLN